MYFLPPKLEVQSHSVDQAKMRLYSYLYRYILHCNIHVCVLAGAKVIKFRLKIHLPGYEVRVKYNVKRKQGICQSSIKECHSPNHGAPKFKEHRLKRPMMYQKQEWFGRHVLEFKSAQDVTVNSSTSLFFFTS